MFKVDFSEDGKVMKVENESNASGKVTVELINHPQITFILNQTVETEITGYEEDEKGKRWVTRDVKPDSQKVIYNARWWIDAFQKGIEYGYRWAVEKDDSNDVDSFNPHLPAAST